jgi:stalled ribosome rescue protein Dom34
MSTNAAVWMNHEQARISRRSRDVIEPEAVAGPEHVYHKHSSGSEGFQQRPEDTRHFFHRVARSLHGSDEILLAGPSTAKLEFFRYLRKHDRALESKIVGIETVDRPTDGRLAAFQRQYFEQREGV